MKEDIIAKTELLYDDTQRIALITLLNVMKLVYWPGITTQSVDALREQEIVFNSRVVAILFDFNKQFLGK